MERSCSHSRNYYCSLNLHSFDSLRTEIRSEDAEKVHVFLSTCLNLNSLKVPFAKYLTILLYITRERAVGNPSAIKGQTANILTSRTGLWARCSTSLLKFEKYLTSLLAETKRRVIPATKFKFFTSTWQFDSQIVRIHPGVDYVN